MDKRKLPLGIETFRRIREEGCCHVDKTPFIWELTERGVLLPLPSTALRQEFALGHDQGAVRGQRGAVAAASRR